MDQPPKSGVWASIVSYWQSLDKLDIRFRDSFVKSLANGSKVSFWRDRTVGAGSCLMDLFPRLFSLESNPDNPFSDRWFHENGYWQGSWAWRRPLRGRVASEFCNLIGLLSHSNFQISGIDKWRWMWDPNGSSPLVSLQILLEKKTPSC